MKDEIKLYERKLGDFFEFSVDVNQFPSQKDAYGNGKKLDKLAKEGHLMQYQDTADFNKDREAAKYGCLEKLNKYKDKLISKMVSDNLDEIIEKYGHDLLKEIHARSNR